MRSQTRLEKDAIGHRALGERFSLKQLKEKALRVLPEGSACRAAILSQPDNVPEEEAIVLAKALSRLLHSESMK